MPDSVAQAYPSATEVRSHLEADAHARSYWKALGLLAIVGSFYAATIVGCVVPIWWIQLLCVPANGLAIAMLFVIGHDSSHACYTPSRRLDHWLARLTLATAWYPNECWKVAHNYFHHGFTNVRGLDTSWAPISLAEYSDKSALCRLLERHYKSWLGLASHWIIRIWGSNVIALRQQSRERLNKNRSIALFDYGFVVVFLTAVVAILVAIRQWISPNESLTTSLVSILLLGLLLPHWMFAAQAGLAILTQHTHPSSIWFANRNEWHHFQANFHSTVHFRYPFPLNRIYLDIMEHNAHHIDTAVPFYKLRRQQARLEEAYPDDILIEDFSVATVNRILRTCQLYDFERHCWLNFHGQPTTEPVELTKPMVGVS